MKTYQNIALCQINVVAGQSEYYIPRNSNWADKKIEKIVLFTDYQSGIKSPVDGSDVLTLSQIGDGLYFDLYDDKGVNIMHNVSEVAFIAENNFPLEVNSKLSYELSRLFFINAPTDSGALMLYIFYNSNEEHGDEIHENITVTFDVEPMSRITLQEVIERYMYARNRGVRAITVWSGSYPDRYRQGYLTLRDVNNKLCHEHIPTYFFRPSYEASWDPNIFPVEKIHLDGVELDFNNSEVFNGLSTKQTFIVTFYY